MKSQSRSRAAILALCCVASVTARGSVLIEMGGPGNAQNLVAEPGETLNVTVSLRSVEEQPVAGLRYTLEFAGPGWQLAARDYAAAGWLANDGLYDASRPLQDAPSLPSLIEPELWPATPHVRDIRFSSVRRPGEEIAVGPVETLTVRIPHDALPGRYSIGFGSHAAYDAQGQPLSSAVGMPLTVGVNSRHELSLVAGGETVSMLAFGLSLAASHGVDPDWDSPAAWPPPPGRPAAAFFTPPEVSEGDLPLAVDVRPDEPLVRWRLHVLVPDGRETATLSWPAAELEPGRLLLLQELVGERPASPPRNMAQGGEIVVSADAVFEIVCGFPVSARMRLAAGWNLIGTGLMGTTPWAGIVSAARAPLVSGALWAWRNGAYRRVGQDAPALAEYGYWAYAPQGGLADEHVGLPADGIMALEDGWQLVTPAVDGQIQVADGQCLPAWHWQSPSGCYRKLAPDESFQKGRGYWLFVSDGGEER